MTEDSIGVVAIRADASLAMGTGHIMRCLALAKQLHRLSKSVTFYSRHQNGDLNGFLNDQGFPVKTLQATQPKPELGERQPYADWLGISWNADALEFSNHLRQEPADWVIVDHYALDARWERHVREKARRLLVIDDLADRPHDGDLLLDANWHPDMAKRYSDYVGSHVKMLLGPQYALLRPEFQKALLRKKVRKGDISKVLVFLGGSDPLNLTAVVLRTLISLNRQHLSIDIVGGRTNPHHAELQDLVRNLPDARYFHEVSNMAELIEKADLAIGGGGQAAWERILLGLPCISIPWADNQIPGTKALAEAGVLLSIDREEATENRLRIELERLLAKPDHVRKMSDRALTLSYEANANGPQRVVEAMKEQSR